MAVPMRLSNNDKCQADTYGPEAPALDAFGSQVLQLLQLRVVAANYGLQNFCADTVDVPQGPQGELKPDLRQRRRPAQPRQHRLHPAAHRPAGL
jgi:hypothetical protein